MVTGTQFLIYISIIIIWFIWYVFKDVQIFNLEDDPPQNTPLPPTGFKKHSILLIGYDKKYESYLDLEENQAIELYCQTKNITRQDYDNGDYSKIDFNIIDDVYDRIYLNLQTIKSYIEMGVLDGFHSEKLSFIKEIFNNKKGSKKGLDKNILDSLNCLNNTVENIVLYSSNKMGISDKKKAMNIITSVFKKILDIDNLIPSNENINIVNNTITKKQSYSETIIEESVCALEKLKFNKKEIENKIQKILEKGLIFETSEELIKHCLKLNV